MRDFVRYSCRKDVSSRFKHEVRLKRVQPCVISSVFSLWAEVNGTMVTTNLASPYRVLRLRLTVAIQYF